jgi:transposase
MMRINQYIEKKDLEEKNLREELHKNIKGMMKENKYFTSTEIKNELESKNIIVSKNTIINILHEIKFSYKNPIDKPLLTEK